ncbi:MAG: S9 family peptidase [Gemmatimonadetes bacterium]|nr:S9 family peptidase [Gemmatimonadota bacterium]
MYRAASFLAATVVFIAATEPMAAQGADDHLTLDLYLDWEQVRAPQISPDGRQIVYTRRWIDKVNDRWQSSLWIMNADGSRNRHLTEGSSPQWSADGDRIAFMRQGEPSGSQIFVRWMDAEGAETQITHLQESPSNVSWAPDGERIAFTMSVPSPSPWRVSLPGRPSGAKWTDEPKVVTRLTYRRDRVGFIDDGYRHLFVVPADGGTARQLTDGDWNHNGTGWTPDSREILFSSNRVEGAEHIWRESEVYAVNVGTKEIRTLTTRHGPDGSPVVSPNGRLVAYSGYDFSDDTFIAGDIYLMSIDGSNPREISGDHDRRARNLTWAPDNSGLYFTSDNQGTTNTYFVSADGGVRQVTEGDHRFQFTNMTDRLLAVGTVTSAHEPGDVVTVDLRNPENVTKLTAVNADVLAGRTLGEVEEIWYTSVDDYQIQGWIIKPPDFDPTKKYPLILSIHGGPHGMYNSSFNFGRQNHAAEGYVVLYTNPRGSSGYGSPFGNAIKRAYPGKDFDDLMAGVDTVINRGYIDNRNMFVYGCSGGGVLTSWVVGHTDRFAAASANCPVINWMSFVGTTDGAGWYRNFDKLPWEDPSEHLRRSPLMYVGNVTTPTMLMTGVNDLRTPMPQTEEYYTALRYLKVPTAMIRFNNEWHGTSSTPSNFLRTQLYLREWFDKYTTKDETNVTSPPEGG